jgi:glyoxylase-like metal-dependent hydrolase (beta-lactamase superfamily II)
MNLQFFSVFRQKNNNFVFMSEMKIHGITGQIEKIYFAEYSDRVLMLDGACTCDVETVEIFFRKQLQRPISDLKLVVSTHMHPDHVGAAQVLHRKFGIPTAAFHSSDKWYRGMGGFFQHFVDFSLSWFVVLKTNKLWKNLWTRRFLKPNYRLFDNNVLPFFYEWFVIHTPGHTDHDICLYNEQQKILYLGDTVIRINEKCMLPFPVVFPEKMSESLQKLAKLEIRGIIQAHGEICSNENPNNLFLELSKKTKLKLHGQFRILNLFVKLTKRARTNLG